MLERELTYPHCCQMMAYQVRRIEQCPHGCIGAHDCPDCVVYHASDDSFGLLLHDGSPSFVQIAYCPWCAARLPGAEEVASGADGSIPDSAISGRGEPGRRMDLNG